MRLILNIVEYRVLVLPDGALDVLGVLRDDEILKIVFVGNWDSDTSPTVSRYS